MTDGTSFYLPVSITGEDAESSVLTLKDVKLVALHTTVSHPHLFQFVHHCRLRGA